jgi:hypothetical protein
MRGTNEENPGARPRGGPAHGVARKQPIPRWIRTTIVVLVVAGYIATAVVAVAVPADSQVLPSASFGFFILSVVTFTVLVVMLVRVVGRLIAIAHSALPAGQRRVRPWAVDAGLAVAVFLGIWWMTAVINGGGFDQRCVNGESMTVVAPANCEGSGTQGGAAATYVWYYGGTGTRIGDSVQGGSLTEPGADDGGGSGSGGGSGGDDGGDGGDGGGDGGDGG